MKRFITVATAVLLPYLGATLPAPGETAQIPPPVALANRQVLEEGQLTFHPATEPNGVGILVVPGGGYSGVSLDYEGANTTAYLNARGYDAWVLNYSTAATAPTPLYPKPQKEALAAVAQIRSENRVSKLGIWGYSAGGHLSAMTLTEPGVALDFGILAYPVITMDPDFTHAGSRRYLIGENPSLELQVATSAETRVTPQTPRTFIFHTANDPVVPVENTLWFVSALAANKVPFQSLVLPDGNHGIALALADPERNWTPELERWMKYSI
ncbi:Alpha/Beta hydrolase protein [Microdochium trichocladiopsis]|uniref:Alpha/Beta hydrolase protein n=1 Tax=Microdochium trichocladiopsis TaxID=1682393 RepID=A0A9P8XY04_9PEZI|nr:Alpha/Beta hydrolase protein [Microdochium trichocladiopsis]KAH7024649.1 Alpha/Beta hydrolase protein [Microdochium trichocladiopsis]